MAILKEEVFQLATMDDKRTFDADVAKLFREWVDFAMGKKDIRFNGKIAHKPRNPSGRYAASLSYTVRKTGDLSYKVSFKADSFEAPEAEAIEFGRKQIDLKEYMLYRDGRQSRAIPIRSVPGMAFRPPAYGVSRKRSSEATKMEMEKAHNAPTARDTKGRSIIRMMTNKPGTWIMQEWPKDHPRLAVDGLPVPFKPAALLMEKLQKNWGGPR